MSARPPPLQFEIGASEVPAILGIDPFKTPEALFRLKLGLDAFEGNEHTRRGEYFEPALIRWHADLAQAVDVHARYAGLPTCGVAKPKQPWQLPQLVARHPGHPWLRATPDVVAECVPVTRTEKALICGDVKCPSSQSKKLAGGAWEKSWSEEFQTAPLNYRVQVLVQIGVCQAAGVPVEFGELFAGPFFGRGHRILIEPDPDFFEMALERALEFRACLLAGELTSRFQTQEQPNE